MLVLKLGGATPTILWVLNEEIVIALSTMESSDRLDKECFILYARPFLLTTGEQSQ